MTKVELLAFNVKATIFQDDIKVEYYKDETTLYIYQEDQNGVRKALAQVELRYIRKDR